MTEEKEPEEKQHYTTIQVSKSRSSAYGRYYKVKCFCGYESGQLSSLRAAEDDATDHVVAATTGD